MDGKTGMSNAKKGAIAIAPFCVTLDDPLYRSVGFGAK
jgi:hypothetical protein